MRRDGHVPRRGSARRLSPQNHARARRRSGRAPASARSLRSPRAAARRSRRRASRSPGRASSSRCPPYAQSIHAGEYPQYGGGGAAWCSPASTAMVIDYWGIGPTAEDLAWVDPALPRSLVSTTRRATPTTPPTTARATGPSTPPMRRASGSTRSSRDSTRCARPSCSSAPASRSSPRSRPDRASSRASFCRRVRTGTSSSSRGFTRDGDPIVNDPAAAVERRVRRIYDRGAVRAGLARWLAAASST